MIMESAIIVRPITGIFFPIGILGRGDEFERY